MVDINPHNRINQVAVNKMGKAAEQLSEKMADPVESMLSKILDRANKELTDVGYFKPIEEIVEDDRFTGISGYGFRIKNYSSDHNDPRKILELVALKKSSSEKTKLFQDEIIGTRERIIARLKDMNLKKKLENFVEDASNKFLLDDY